MFNKVESKTKELTGAAQGKLGELTDSAEHHAKGVVKKYADQGTGALQVTADAVKEQIESNPASTVIITGLVGLVLGYFIGRK